MEIRILGPVRVCSGTTDISLKGSKQRTFLAALLLAGERVLPDSTLGEMLWGSRPPATYQAQIYTYASQLRRQLGQAVHIARQGAGYFLTIGSAWFDYREFQRQYRAGRAALQSGQFERSADLLRAALDLWRGPALADVSAPLTERERPGLDEVRMEALAARIDADLALGRHREIVPELISLVGAHPLRERFRAQLMTGLHRSDRQAEAFDLYYQGSRLLLEELGVDPSPTLRSAYELLLRVGEEATADVPAAPQPERIEAAPPVPAMLPADTYDFVGYPDALRAAARLLRRHSGDQPQHSTLAVTGMGGVGKTTLAVHAAHMCAADFPDGQLFLDLQGSSHLPVRPEDALSVLLRALGAAEPLPRSMEERMHLYRSLLASRRVLVVLDDAAGADQIRPLLPGGPMCRTIVTSRLFLSTAAGQHMVSLKPFTPAQALDLLGRIAGAERIDTEPEAARRIVQACGSLALAVRIAGIRLASRPHWSVAQLAERLAGGAGGLAEFRAGDLDLRASLDRSFQRLNAIHRLALLRLATAGMESFPAAAVATLLGCDEPEAEQIAEALVDQRMLELADLDDTGVFAYQVHPLVGLLAFERLQNATSSQPALAALVPRPRIAQSNSGAYTAAESGGDRRAGARGGTGPPGQPYRLSSSKKSTISCNTPWPASSS
ncbi:AfsR/SARP family transcriptional regulator [Salinispora pacifica]|uniref:AfsR/SARP family transcriptional regulator n=1 Tax=Salinispora pacifica TaxID=351187 RepID=UPI00035D578F|nr:BTAD domain-containing putative transcriptional regulator [Salinispora pacifica]